MKKAPGSISDSPEGVGDESLPTLDRLLALERLLFANVLSLCAAVDDDAPRLLIVGFDTDPLAMSDCDAIRLGLFRAISNAVVSMIAFFFKESISFCNLVI